MTLKEKIQKYLDESINDEWLAGGLTFIAEDYTMQMMSFLSFHKIKIEDCKYYLPDGTLIAENNEEMLKEFRKHYKIKDEK
ncbi:hypothetical protein GOQ30_17830 [Flavobacterium sp. TP390]|uniref:Uncharacterized protein n=1 Tax=Flavobacterium profundi TaxID=1774945 RepID=A0A6I4IVR6_9FLAO|nr:hypothetical protein [Flavobacterium profundi]MVO11037.1 hypothetical protein [Flavobacterium profundi]